MDLRVVEVVASRENLDAVTKAAEKHEAIDCWRCTSPRQQPVVLQDAGQVRFGAGPARPASDRAGA